MEIQPDSVATWMVFKILYETLYDLHRHYDYVSFGGWMNGWESLMVESRAPDRNQRDEIGSSQSSTQFTSITSHLHGIIVRITGHNSAAVQVRREDEGLSKDPIHHGKSLGLSFPSPRTTMQLRIQSIGEISVQVHPRSVISAHEGARRRTAALL